MKFLSSTYSLSRNFQGTLPLIQLPSSICRSRFFPYRVARPYAWGLLRGSRVCLAPMQPPSKVAPPGTAMDGANSTALPRSRQKAPEKHEFPVSSFQTPFQSSSVMSSTASRGGDRKESISSDCFLTNSVHAVRTIGIVAHIDAGKTTTTERMLYYAGVVQRVGDVDSGTTTTDYLKDEMERGITIQSALVTLRWRGHPIYLLDTPGHADFTVEVERSVRVVDGVVALLDASAGVQAQSYTVLAQSIKYSVPVVFFINKMDKFNANFEMAVKSMEQKLKIEPLLLQFPLNGDDSEFSGVVDLVKLQCYRFRGNHGEIVESIPLWGNSSEKSITNSESNTILGDGQYKEVLLLRHQLLTQLTAVDDILSEQFILALDETDGDEEKAEILLSSAAIQAAIRRVLILPPPASSNGSAREGRPRRMLCPVLCGAARRDIGVQPLLHAIVDYFPSPLERHLNGVNPYGAATSLPMSSLVPPFFADTLRPPSANSATVTPGTSLATRETSMLQAMPFWALAFKVCHTINQASGKREALVYIRVFSGILRSVAGGGGKEMGGGSGRGRVLQNRSRGVEENVGTLYVLHANTPIEVSVLRPGEVGALFLKKTYTGDTLYAPPRTGFAPTKRDFSKGWSNDSFALPSYLSPLSESDNSSTTHDTKQKMKAAPSLQQNFTSKPSSTSVCTATFTSFLEKKPTCQSESTETDLDEVFLLEGIHSPPPVLSYSIEAATPGQAKQLDEALVELTREDPSLSFHSDDYGNRVLQGLGELHLEIALSRLRQEYELQCRLLRAVVEYRETLLSSRRLDHISVCTEHGVGTPYAELSISVEPCHVPQISQEASKDVGELFLQDEASESGIDEADEDFYASCATPQFLLSPSLFSPTGESNSFVSSSSVSSSSGSRMEEKKRLREWARALQESFQHSVAEVSRLGPLAGMPLHGIIFTLHSFRVLGDGGRVVSSGKQLLPSFPPNERVLRAIARNVLITLIHGRKNDKKVASEDSPEEREKEMQTKKVPNFSDDFKSKTSASTKRRDIGILEPIMQVEIHFTEDGYVGEVIRTLHDRRAIWMDVSNATPERGGTLKALVPMRLLSNYSTTLRAVVKGHASLSTQLHSYRLLREEDIYRKILRKRGC